MLFKVHRHIAARMGLAYRNQYRAILLLIRANFSLKTILKGYLTNELVTNTENVQCQTTTKVF